MIACPARTKTVRRRNRPITYLMVAGPLKNLSANRFIAAARSARLIILAGSKRGPGMTSEGFEQPQIQSHRDKAARVGRYLRCIYYL